MPHFDRQVPVRRSDRFQLLLPAVDFLLGAEANLAGLFGKLAGEEVEHLLRFRRAAGVFDAGVDVFRVLAEDHHVDQLRLAHRAGHALEVAHWPQADEQIEQLSQCHVERADAAADRRRERAFDADAKFAKRVERFVGQPVAVLFKRFLAG